MDLFDKVSEDIKTAMKAKDRVRLEALRGIKKEFIEGKTAPGADGTLTDEAALKILVRMAKQRHESADIFAAQNRPELAREELLQAQVIEEYLPKQLTAQELEEKLRHIIQRLGATTAKDMGRVMGTATKELAGLADGKAVAAKVKELLA